MPNSIITSNLVLKEVGRVAVNNLKFASNITRFLSDDYRADGGKVGFTVSVRLPQRFVTNKGQALTLQPITDTVVPITLTDQANIGFGWSSASWAMEIEMVRQKYVNPAGSQLANTMDRDALVRSVQDVYQAVGTPNVVPNSSQTYLNGGVLMTNSSVPMDPRTAVVSPQMMATLVGTATLAANLFNPQTTISAAYKTGIFAQNWLGFEEWYQDQNVSTTTVGVFGGAPIVVGALQTGSSIATSGWTATTTVLNKGDRFTIAGVFSVNPQNYGSTGALQVFVVTTPTVTDGGGLSTISISPSIITSGPFQTVTASPAASAVITVLGATGVQMTQGVGFHKDAFVMATADLPEPNSGKFERVRSKELGIAIRFWQSSDIMTDSHPSRLDVLYGVRTVRPDWACVFLS